MKNAIYIKSDAPLDILADSLRSVLNIPPCNRSPWATEQSREGANYGGQYYHFEILGLILELVRNQGEVQVDEWTGWDYYVVVSMQMAEAEDDLIEAITIHIARTLSQAGLTAEPGEL